VSGSSIMLIMLSDLVRSLGRIRGACLNVLARCNCGLNGGVLGVSSSVGKGIVTGLDCNGLNGGDPPSEGKGIVSGLEMVIIGAFVRLSSDTASQRTIALCMQAEICG
jgi:hypothetical protein